MGDKASQSEKHVRGADRHVYRFHKLRLGEIDKYSTLENCSQTELAVKQMLQRRQEDEIGRFLDRGERMI